jgi:hypothetical protein
MHSIREKALKGKGSIAHALVHVGDAITAANNDGVPDPDQEARERMMYAAAFVDGYRACEGDKPTTELPPMEIEAKANARLEAIDKLRGRTVAPKKGKGKKK